MDLTKLSKTELLKKCEELRITKYKSKNKCELIELINTHISIKPIEIIIENDHLNINKNFEQELQGLYCSITKMNGIELFDRIKISLVPVLL